MLDTGYSLHVQTMQYMKLTFTRSRNTSTKTENADLERGDLQHKKEIETKPHKISGWINSIWKTKQLISGPTSHTCLPWINHKQETKYASLLDHCCQDKFRKFVNVNLGIAVDIKLRE